MATAVALVAGRCIATGDRYAVSSRCDRSAEGKRRPASYGADPEDQGNSASPRLSVGVGINWTSPFGPLRIDLAKALLKQPGDDTKLVTFNVGTQF